MPKNCQIESENSSILFLPSSKDFGTYSTFARLNKTTVAYFYFSLIFQEAQQQVETTGQGKRQNCSVRQTNTLSLTLALPNLEGFLWHPLTWTLEQCSQHNNTLIAIVLKMLAIFR